MGSDGTLVRRPVSGGGGGGGIEVYRVDENDPPFALQLQTTDTGLVMRLFVAEESDAVFEPMGGEVLTLLDAADVASMPISDYAGDIEVEYVAEVDDGRLFVVLRPREIKHDLDYRAFLGPVDDLVEREVTSFVREKDGGTTTIELHIDDETATAFLPVTLLPDGGVELGPSTLEAAGETHALTLLAAEPPADAAYRCLDDG